MGKERLGDGQTLLHPVRIVLHPVLAPALKTHQAQDFIAPLPGRASREQREDLQVSVGAQVRIEGGRLDDGAHARERGVVPAAQVMAEQLDRAGVRAHETGEHAHRRAFPGAVGPEEPKDIASAHLQADPIDHLALAIALAEPGRAQDDIRRQALGLVWIGYHARSPPASKRLYGCAAAPGSPGVLPCWSVPGAGSASPCVAGAPMARR